MDHFLLIVLPFKLFVTFFKPGNLSFQKAVILLAFFELLFQFLDISIALF
jgi:hypothetical protein